MELHITVDLTGEAFETDTTGELLKVLHRVHTSVWRSAPLHVGDSGSANDTNGTVHARWEVRS